MWLFSQGMFLFYKDLKERRAWTFHKAFWVLSLTKNTTAVPKDGSEQAIRLLSVWEYNGI